MGWAFREGPRGRVAKAQSVSTDRIEGEKYFTSFGVESFTKSRLDICRTRYLKNSGRLILRRLIQVFKRKFDQNKRSRHGRYHPLIATRPRRHLFLRRFLKWQFQERVELFRGKITKTSPAPSIRHQAVSPMIRPWRIVPTPLRRPGLSPRSLVTTSRRLGMILGAKVPSRSRQLSISWWPELRFLTVFLVLRHEMPRVAAVAHSGGLVLGQVVVKPALKQRFPKVLRRRTA